MNYFFLFFLILLSLILSLSLSLLFLQVSLRRGRALATVRAGEVPRMGWRCAVMCRGRGWHDAVEVVPELEGRLCRRGWAVSARRQEQPGSAAPPCQEQLQADFGRLDRMALATARRGSSRRCGHSSHARSSAPACTRRSA